MLKLWKAVGLVAVVGMWILVLPEIGLAQQASIVGTVVDASKAVVPGANVTATPSRYRQAVRQDVSTENGAYRIVGVTPRPVRSAGRRAGLWVDRAQGD